MKIQNVFLKQYGATRLFAPTQKMKIVGQQKLTILCIEAHLLL